MIVRRSLALAFALLLAPAQVLAQDAAPAQAQVFAQLSGADVNKRVQAIIDLLKTRPAFVGLSVAVARGDRIIVDRGAGVADLEWNQAADAKTVFRIGSLTKQFTAAAIMKLAEQGKLGLDDRLSRYVPEFDTGGRAVTIRQLLNHTSGIPNYTAQPGFVNREAPLALTEQEVLKLVAGVPFDFEPGTNWRYSNTNYFLLGMIVEKVSGRSYADFMQHELFDPLGLTHTRYGSLAPIIPERAQGYEFDLASGTRRNASPIGMTIPGGAGGLVSTAGDLLRWQIALTNGRAVSPASFQQMITSTAKTGLGAATYGFGLMNDRAGSQRRIWHNGGINGFNSVLSWWPDLGLRTAVISNSEALSSETVESLIVAALTSDKPLKPLRSTQQAGAEMALRNLIVGVADGNPDYSVLTPQMADVTRTQLTVLQQAFRNLGALQSIAFESVDLDDVDQYLVKFSKGTALFTISLDAQGKVGSVRFIPIPPAAGP